MPPEVFVPRPPSFVLPGGYAGEHGGGVVWGAGGMVLRKNLYFVRTVVVSLPTSYWKYG